MLDHSRNHLNSAIRTMLGVFLSVFVLSACGSGGGGGTDGGSSSGAVDGGVTSSTATSVGSVDEGQTVGTTAGATDHGTAGAGTDEAGDVAGDTAGGTAGESDGSTSGESDAGSAGESDGSTSGESDAGTAGESDAGTAGESDSGVIGDLDPTPIVRAPADAQILLTETLELNGSIIFNAMPIAIPIIDWQRSSGPGNASFTNNQSANTKVIFDAAGTYELQLSVSNGPYSSSDTMQVVVTSEVINQAPTVNAGPDEVLTIDAVLNLSAQIDDDDLPTATLTSEWSKFSGPGEVTFGDANAKDTTVTFSTTGVYFLLFEGSDGELTGDDLIKVTVNVSPPVDNSGDNVNASNEWEVVTTSNGSKPQARHEAGALAFQNQFYLMGGRGLRQVNRYNPANNRWENLGTPDLELSHFQPVVYAEKIYVLGSLDCCFPRETVIAKIQIFDPETKTWTQGASIPQNRRRGSAGTVSHNNKIYMVGGSTNGHDGGMVNWFDEYDPANNSWKTLPNAPTERDHFSVAIVGNKLIVAGGRKTDHPNTFSNLVAEVDIYNFSTGQWESGAPIKTKRAGAMTVSYGEEVIVIGGESDRGVPALDTVEAYNVNTDTWRTLDSLNTARHSGGAAIIDGAIHVVSGNTTTGGGNETQTHEKLKLK